MNVLESPAPAQARRPVSDFPRGSGPQSRRSHLVMIRAQPEPDHGSFTDRLATCPPCLAHLQPKHVRNALDGFPLLAPLFPPFSRLAPCYLHRARGC